MDAPTEALTWSLRTLLNTNLQAVAASATLHRTICSIYVPLHDQIIDTKLDQLLQQLPHPFILMGH